MKKIMGYWGKGAKVFSLFLCCLVLTVKSVADESPSSLVKLEMPSKDVLSSLVEQRWKAFSKHDFSKVYDYQTPNYRNVFPRELYVERFSNTMKWTLTSVESIKYDSDHSFATVEVLVEAKGSHESSFVTDARRNEIWLYVDGKWWHSSSK